MRRRDFITLLGCATAWPIAARGQQRSAKRRIGLLMGPQESDPEGQARAAAFRDALVALGWAEGHNVQLDLRWVGGDLSRARAYANELSERAADVIMANGTAQLAAAQRATKSIPIVFAQVSDPVGGGFVGSISRPGGNITGCTDFEYSFGVKWLEVLKTIAPAITRAAVIFDPNNPNSAKFIPPIESAGSSLDVTVSKAPVRSGEDIDRAIDTFADPQPGGLIVLPSVPAIENQARIFAGASRRHLPAVYPYRAFAVRGGLSSYGVNTFDMYRCAARYVDRILKGENPGDLPVQFATRFELVINLKTAAALGLGLSPQLLARADEVIE